MGILFKSDKDKIDKDKSDKDKRDKDKHEVPAVPVEPATPAPVFLNRNLQNRATEPEALEEEFEIFNGLVHRVSNNPEGSMAYILDTEDFLQLRGRNATSASVANEHLPREASQKETLRARRYNRLFRSL